MKILTLNTVKLPKIETYKLLEVLQKYQTLEVLDLGNFNNKEDYLHVFHQNEWIETMKNIIL